MYSKTLKPVVTAVFMIIILITGAAVSAESFWDGSISTARYGYLPDTGLYAASNAFPSDTMVTVKNPETGSSVDVRIIKRLDSNSFLLVLSREAAESVGIKQGEVFQGKIAETPEQMYTESSDLAYNPDPDINPSAAGTSTELAIIEEYLKSGAGEGDIPDEITPSESVSVPEPPEVVETEEIIEENQGPEPEPAVEIVVNEPETEPAEAEPAEADEPVVTADNLPENPEPEEPVLEEPVPELAEKEPALTEDDIEPETSDVPVAVSVTADIPRKEELPETEILPELEIREPETEPEDVPAVASMTSASPGKDESLLPMEIPEISEPETVAEVPVETEEPDSPEAVLMKSAQADKGNGEPVFVLPEMPLIASGETEEDIPAAVSMSADVVMVEEEESEFLLPEVVIEEPEDNAPVAEIIPDAEAVETAEIASADHEPEVVVSAETAPEEEIEAEPEESPVTETPEPEMETEIVLEPSELRPPEKGDEVAEAETETVETAEEPAEAAEPEAPEIVESSGSERYTVTTNLVKDSYYLQLGAYRERYSAMTLADKLGSTFPVTVLVSESTGFVSYKVMVGPLGQDESGAVLFSLRSGGYPDAFLRKGL